ncbi:hypothetical protein O6H91_20G077400 [Diphasiastrum complanatum]|uniref:Uncharacterized protein n=1 Tax=Diphasiastrum complanatum TaxID=34168 RepID=A0ACC2ARX6_DIPCM|nr:hypothetical protein O6H91_20G077400 [Diphasiastrum complanatum]
MMIKSLPSPLLLHRNSHANNNLLPNILGCCYYNSHHGCAARSLKSLDSRPSSALDYSPVSETHGEWCQIRQLGRQIKGVLQLLRTERRSISRCAGVVRMCSSRHDNTLNQEVGVSVLVSIEDSVVVNPELQAIVKQLETDGPLAVKLAVIKNGLVDGEREIELSVLICDDNYIQKLNKQWLGQDRPTDVISYPQGQPPEYSPILVLGDVVISAETAARQAGERGHTFLDEIRILLVHGLLHLLGYDHERNLQSSKKMEVEEERILCSLGWEGKALIAASWDANGTLTIEDGVGQASENEDRKAKDGVKTVLRLSTSPFRLLFCDMDGTLLNSSSKVTQRTAKAVRAAIQHGVQVVIATGKTRPAAIRALRAVGLEGEGGAISTTSPGVFLQGLLVYGTGGSLLHKHTLNLDLCEEAEAISFLEDFRRESIQKLLFYSTSETIANFVRPHWLSVTQGRATVTQALPEMLEILPRGASKGAGVKMLLDELRISPNEVMAIGDGENDIEMLKLVGLGVVMGNGAAQTIAVADAKVGSNDEDGVAEAIERYILP